MGKKCQVCLHSNRLNIDREIINGKSLAEISRKYNVSYDSLWLHSKNHLNYQLVTAVKKKMENNSLNLMDEVEEIIRKAKIIFDRNFEKNTRSGDETALRALNEHRQTLNLLSEAISTYYHIKALEYDQELKKAEFEASEELKKGLKRLTDNELAIAELLMAKIYGKFKGNVFRTLGIKIEPGILRDRYFEEIDTDLETDDV